MTDLFHTRKSNERCCLRRCQLPTASGQYGIIKNYSERTITKTVCECVDVFFFVAVIGGVYCCLCHRCPSSNCYHTFLFNDVCSIHVRFGFRLFCRFFSAIRFFVQLSLRTIMYILLLSLTGNSRAKQAIRQKLNKVICFREKTKKKSSIQFRFRLLDIFFLLQ